MARLDRDIRFEALLCYFLYNYTTNCQIFHGYVARERLDLYKKNSRVKDIEIIDLDNNIKYSFTLLDEVRIQTIKMTQWTKNIKLIIQSVYKGDKWDDTCITSIIPELVY